jgi:hypothetical protein
MTIICDDNCFKYTLQSNGHLVYHFSKWLLKLSYQTQGVCFNPKMDFNNLQQWVWILVNNV